VSAEPLAASIDQSCPNADLHDAGDNVSLLGKEHLDPINYSAHAGRAAQITVDNDPVFGSDFWDRWGQSFKQRMAVSHITGQHAAPSAGADRLQMHQHR